MGDLAAGCGGDWPVAEDLGGTILAEVSSRDDGKVSRLCLGAILQGEKSLGGLATFRALPYEAWRPKTSFLQFRFDAGIFLGRFTRSPRTRGDC